MNLVEFDLSKGGSVWVNPWHVVYLIANATGTVITVAGGVSHNVKQNPNEVTDALALSSSLDEGGFDMADLFGGMDMETLMAELESQQGEIDEHGFSEIVDIEDSAEL